MIDKEHVEELRQEEQWQRTVDKCMDAGVCQRCDMEIDAPEALDCNGCKCPCHTLV